MAEKKKGKVDKALLSPLKIGIVGGQLKISIGLKILAHAAQELSAEQVFQETGEVLGPKYKVKNLELWAKEVVEAIQKENEIGESPLTNLLDAAFEEAQEQGGFGTKELIK